MYSAVLMMTLATSGDALDRDEVFNKMRQTAVGDLQFGYRKGDARDLFLTPEDFDREWASARRVFVVGDRSLKIPGAVVLLDGPRQVLLSNRPMPEK